MLKNFGKAIKAAPNRNGFLPLRGAIISAAFDPEGLTVINILRQFPLPTIYLDFSTTIQFFERGRQYLQDRQAIINKFTTNNYQNNTNLDRKNYRQNLQTPGLYGWNKQTFSFKNPNRSTDGKFDLYLPESTTPAPVIVISHGLASNRRTFAYLGQHLVSYGFAVVIIEHIDTSLDKFDRFLAGLERLPEATNLIDRPLDVKSVLDKLTQESVTNPSLQGKLNLERVGAIGQSLGGYTVLNLGGAKLSQNKMAKECQADQIENIFADLSSWAKCSFNNLSTPQPDIQDKRIKAVLAINPLAKMFGQEGISQIKIPTMLVAGINDLITPPVPEQMQPFTWLTNKSKYLVLVKAGTHFSFLEKGIGVLPVPDSIVGPDSHLAHPALNALSTAFFKTHLANEPQYQIYLRPEYLASLNTNPFQLSIMRSLNKLQLEQAIKRQLD